MIFYKIKKRQPSFVSYSHYSLGMYSPRQWYLIVCESLTKNWASRFLAFMEIVEMIFLWSSWCFLLFIYLLTMSQVALSSASKFQGEHNRPSSHKSCVRSLNPYWFLKLDLRCVVEIILSRAQLMHVLIAYFNRFFFFNKLSNTKVSVINFYRRKNSILRRLWHYYDGPRNLWMNF